MTVCKICNYIVDTDTNIELRQINEHGQDRIIGHIHTECLEKAKKLIGVK